MRRKLVLELAGWQPPALEMLTLAQAAAPYDCLVGEKRWQERQRIWD